MICYLRLSPGCIISNSMFKLLIDPTLQNWLWTPEFISMLTKVSTKVSARTVWGGAGGHRLLADVIARWRALGSHDGLHPLLLLSCWTGLGLGFHGDRSFLNTSWRRENCGRRRKWRVLKDGANGKRWSTWDKMNQLMRSLCELFSNEVFALLTDVFMY